MRALIVEDDEALARLIARILRREGVDSVHRTHVAEAMTCARSGDHDLVILDRTLPDGDGLALCVELRRAGSTVPIMMVTGRGEVEERVRGLEAGADDYLVKPFAVGELRARIGVILRRLRASSRLRIGGLEVDCLRRVVFTDGHPVDLTSREYRLLVHLAENRGRTVSRDELLARVWTADPRSNTISVYISRLRSKLGRLGWMIDTCFGEGYRLRETPTH